MSATTVDKAYLATDVVFASVKLAYANNDIGVVLTTKSGSRYLLVWHEGNLLAAKKAAGSDRTIKPGEWFKVGQSVDDIVVHNIWGSLKLGPWTTTSVTKVELKSREKGGESSLFTVFER